MTSESTPPAGARGAVDLSAITETQSTMPNPRGVPGGLVVEVTESNLSEELGRTVAVPGVLVIWSSAHGATADLVNTVARVAAGYGGRLLVLTADLTAQPGLFQAFQPLLMQAFGQPAVPACFGLLQGQPVPLFPGIAPEAEVRAVLEELLATAVQNGITGRVTLDDLPEDEEPTVPPLHQEAFDAIERGDLTAAAVAYEAALAADPKDNDAELGLAQVRLLQRTEGVDPVSARAAAAADPTSVDAAVVVADLDLLGGHVEDAFARLLDLVRVSAGADRDQARTHLLDLFAVVGNQDERVRKGRTALMSALF